MVICIGPFFLNTIDFAIPSTIPFINPKSFIGFAVNVIVQSILELGIVLFCFASVSILLVSVGHLWVEMRIIHTISRSLGAYEETERLRELTEEEDLEVIETLEEITVSTESMKIITCMHIEVIQ